MNNVVGKESWLMKKDDWHRKLIDEEGCMKRKLIDKESWLTKKVDWQRKLID